MMVFLCRLCFGFGSDIHAASYQFWIVFKEVDGERRHPGDKDEAIEPSLPVIQRVSRREQQYGYEQHRQDGSEQRVAGEVAGVRGHAFPFAIRQ
jgi:hypothetical protein